MIKSFRKRKFINHKKRILYVSLFFLLLLISIGYAYISTSLSINGVSTIAANSWSIHFANLNVSNGSSVASTPAAIQNDTTKINYSVLLDLPGDFYEFEVDVVNSGTIPGKVSLVNISGISSEAEPYLESSVKYVNGSQVQIGDILNPGTSKRIVVRVGYIEDLNTLPEDTIELDLEFEVDYSQTEDEEMTLGTIVQQLKTNSTSCFLKYEGDVTDEVGQTVTASNVYFDNCESERNIIFGGYCWQAIRTTETGGLKMVYNGEPVDGKCESNRGNHKGIVGGSGEHVDISSEYLYGSTFTYDTTNNTFTLVDIETAIWSDSTYEDLLGKYTCKSSNSTCSTMYNVNSYYSNEEAYVSSYVLDNSNYSTIGESVFNPNYFSTSMVGYMFNKSYNSQKKEVDNTQYKYGNSFTYSNGVYTLSGTTKTINNWSSGYNQLDNTHYTCWNTSGTCSKISYIYYTTSTEANYIEITGGKSISDALTDMLRANDVNRYNSSAKGIIDAWYRQNLFNYAGNIEDAVYCNDRDIINIGGFNPNNSTTTDYAISFDSFINYSTLGCSNVLDQFSVSNNKARLTYPVGLLGIEDLFNLENPSLYTTGGYYWTITPSSFGDYSGAVARVVYDDGGLFNADVDYNQGIRPVVSLDYNTQFTGGTGSEIDPWIVE